MPATSRPRTVFLGSGTFGRPALHDLLHSTAVDLVAVVTAPPRVAGRGKRVTPSPIETAARDLGIDPVLTPIRLRVPDAVAAVLALEPALVVLADYGQLVPPAILDLPFGALNLHPSLLPRHRGASPIPATILAGDERTGVTLMKMDPGLDTGPLIAVREMALSGHETAPELEEALAAAAAALLRETLEPWLRGDIAARPQPVAGATLTRPLRRDDGRLDPARPAVLLERQVRAYQPWPGSWLETPEGRVIAWRATVAPTHGDAIPGTMRRAPGGLELATVDGTLVIEEAQLAGGRRMPAAALLRGHASLGSS